MLIGLLQADMEIAIGTPPEFLKALVKVFPSYVHDADGDLLTYHGILSDFVVYFGANNGTFKGHQLRELAGIIDVGVESGGDLENAFSTCFLEHLDQVRAKAAGAVPFN